MKPHVMASATLLTFALPTWAQTSISTMPWVSAVMSSYSLNVDYQVLPNVLWRTEIKHFDGNAGAFIQEDGTSSSHHAMAVTSLAVTF